MANPPPLSDDDAAYDRAVFSLRPDAGYLRIQGAARAEFLQRQTTDDLTRLTSEPPFHAQELQSR